MTYSIVACDPQEKAWGVAVASKFLAVGGVVPWARAGVGAIATQSFANTSYGERGLALLAHGHSAGQALETLLSEDPGRETRQVGIVDAHGNSASFTGSSCPDWAGGVSGDGYAIQGNILPGAKVAVAMERKFLSSRGDLPSRLYAALLAGDRAGGDRRGRQSAAILVVKPGGGYGGYNDRWIDYRVDDDPDPVLRLGGLLEMHHLYMEPSPEALRVPIRGKTRAALMAILAREGYLEEHTSFEEALIALIGNENFEERCDFKGTWIDKPVLKFLMKKFI